MEEERMTHDGRNDGELRIRRGRRVRRWGATLTAVAAAVIVSGCGPDTVASGRTVAEPSSAAATAPGASTPTPAPSPTVNPEPDSQTYGSPSRVVEGVFRTPDGWEGRVRYVAYKPMSVSGSQLFNTCWSGSNPPSAAMNGIGQTIGESTQFKTAVITITITPETGSAGVPGTPIFFSGGYSGNFNLRKYGEFSCGQASTAEYRAAFPGEISPGTPWATMIAKASNGPIPDDVFVLYASLVLDGNKDVDKATKVECLSGTCDVKF
jgi:hypothetical protein